MPKVPQLLKIDPPEAISFTGPFTEVVTSTLTLKNPTDNRTAFKVKTTAPKRYCVRPNSGVLAKDESITVSVMLQPFEFDPLEKTKHKFMIQSLVMVGDIEEKEVWKEADQDKLMDTKLRVVFDMNNAEQPSIEENVTQNDLDVPTEAVEMTPQKANVKTTKVVKPSGDDEYEKAKEENTRLVKEVASLKEESQRLRRIAMNDTIASGNSGSSSQSGAALPTGIGLLFHDTTNILLVLILCIATFSAGLFLSNQLLGS